MFSTHCAAEVLSSAAKLCYSCGKELNEKADEPKSRKLSYEDFRKRKAEERGWKFSKKARGNAPSFKNTEASEVIIHIGVMIWKDGELATRRGSSLSLKVPSNATSEVLKAKAVAKQNRFKSSLIKGDKALGHKLLYPDKSEVLRDFTWQKDLEFTLGKYKEELGKAYSRISFYLCSKIDYLSYVADGVDSSD